MEYFSIKPNPLVIKDIENNFIMKSLTFIEDAKKVKQSSRLSRYEMLFLGSYLPWVARALKINKKADKEWIAVVTIESIAGRLRMHRFLETHQKKRVRRILNDAYKLAKSCGYLLDYSIDNKGKLGLVDHLTLNPEKFNL